MFALQKRTTLSFYEKKETIARLREHLGQKLFWCRGFSAFGPQISKPSLSGIYFKLIHTTFLVSFQLWNSQNYSVALIYSLSNWTKATFISRIQRHQCNIYRHVKAEAKTRYVLTKADARSAAVSDQTVWPTAQRV